MFFGADRVGEELQGLGFGEEGDGDVFAVERVEDAHVASGDEHPAARAEHIEGLGVPGAPDVIEHEQHRLGLEEVPQDALGLRQRGERGVAAEVLGKVALAGEQGVFVQVLAAGNPDDAVGIGLAHFSVAGEGGGEHRFADAAHSLHANLGIGARNDLRLLEIHQQRVAHVGHQAGPGEEMGRQVGYAVQRAQLRVGLLEVGDKLGESGRIFRVVAEILAVQQAQLAGHADVVVAPPEDRGYYHMVVFQRRLPFLAHVRGLRRLRPAHIDHPFHFGADGVLDLLVERQPARHQRLAVEPDLEPGILQVGA